MAPAFLSGIARTAGEKLRIATLSLPSVLAAASSVSGGGAENEPEIPYRISQCSCTHFDYGNPTATTDNRHKGGTEKSTGEMLMNFTMMVQILILANDHPKLVLGSLLCASMAPYAWYWATGSMPF